MIKSEIEQEEITANSPIATPYLLGASIVVVLCAVVLIALLASGINNGTITAPHSTVSNVPALPLATPSGSSISGTGTSQNAPATQSPSSLSSQSYNLQNNVPGKVKQPTTNSLQTSGPSSGQSINSNYPY